MENMGAVLMDLDALYFLTIQVSSRMGTLVQDQSTFPGLLHLVGNHGSAKTGPNYQVIVHNNTKL